MTLEAGSKLRLDGVDESNQGEPWFTELNEILVESGGTLDLTGVAGDSVRIASSESPPEDWYGIRLSPGATLTGEYATLEHGTMGLIAEGGGTFTLRHCRFSSMVYRAMIVTLNSVVSGLVDSCTFGWGLSTAMEVNSPTVTVKGCMFAGGSESGITINSPPAAVVIQGNTISNFTTAGIALGSGSAIIESNAISGMSLGSGVSVAGGSATLERNTLTGNKWGVYVTGGTATLGDAGDSGSDNVFTGNTRGLFCNWSPGSGAGSLVRNNHFTGNTYGVFVARTSSGSQADLGSTTPGLNSFSTNATNCIRNASTTPVSAIGNWFGAYPPPICWWGPVLVSDPLEQEPASAPVGVVRVTQPGLLGVWPNPVRTEATIDLAGEAGARMDVQLFDVTGRLVRTLRTERGGGMQHVTWDGRDGNGVEARSGVYFLRVWANGRELGTSRLLVVR